MSSQKSLSSLMVSGLVITGLVGFNSIALAKDVQDTQKSPETQSQQNTKNPVQASTQTNWWCSLYRDCD